MVYIALLPLVLLVLLCAAPLHATETIPQPTTTIAAAGDEPFFAIHAFTLVKSLELQQQQPPPPSKRVRRQQLRQSQEHQDIGSSNSSSVPYVAPLLQWKQDLNLTLSLGDHQQQQRQQEQPSLQLTVDCSLHEPWSEEGDALNATLASRLSCSESAVNATVLRAISAPERGFYLFLSWREQDPAVWTVASLVNDRHWTASSWVDLTKVEGDAIWHTSYTWEGGDVRVESEPTVPIMQWLEQSSADSG